MELSFQSTTTIHQHEHPAQGLLQTIIRLWLFIRLDVCDVSLLLFDCTECEDNFICNLEWTLAGQRSSTLKRVQMIVRGHISIKC